MHKVVVMMATYNGVAWIEEQIDSILNQADVEVTVIVSDDFSGDGTYEKLEQLAQSNPQIVLLPRDTRMGSAGKNFYRLICDAAISEFDYVAFADQDDVWYPRKLYNSISALIDSNADGYSSDVLAFWPDGRELYVKKSYSQKAYDYMFEAPGPGCTFVLNKQLASTVKSFIKSNRADIKSFFHHDWLIYAIARNEGYKWIIDDRDTMRYRQHQSNETGVNNGLKAIKARILKLRSGWYLDHVYHLARIFNKDMLMKKLLGGRSSWRLSFVFNFLKCRRRCRDAFLLLVFVVFRIAR